MRGTALIGAVLLATGLLAGPMTGTALAASFTFTVNTPGNAADLALNHNCDTSPSAGSQCTLRAAIQEANYNPGPDKISFDLPAPYLIELDANGLPQITSRVLIDGTSEPAYNPAGGVIVRVDGGGAVADDFNIQQAGSQTSIQGLEIVGAYTAGIWMQGTFETNVRGDYIGTTAASGTGCTSGVGCGDNIGVAISDGSNNTVGGMTATDRNIISNNAAYGVEIVTSSGTADGNTVEGNYIGTNVAGNAALPNGYGIEVGDGAGSGPTGTLIGGTIPGAGNVVSGNTTDGIYLDRPEAMTIAGNLIGLNAAGTAAVPNDRGLQLAHSSDLTIGGADVASRNVISGNSEDGILGIGDTGATVQNNYIGTDEAGTSAIGNAGLGVEFYSGDNLTMSSNVVSGNQAAYAAEVYVQDSAGPKVTGNIAGLGADGTTTLAATCDGLQFYDDTDATVWDNLTSGHPCAGIDLQNVTGATVTDNISGTDASGTIPRPNGQAGVSISDSSQITVGMPGHPNQLSANTGSGLSATGLTDSTIEGNLIGTTPTGTAGMSNGTDGISLTNSSDLQVGGSGTGAGNVIATPAAASGDASISLTGTTDTSILDNRVGVGSDGTVLHNGYDGIDLDSASNHDTIGTPAAPNTIAGSVHTGICNQGQHNRFQANAIYSNGALGVDNGCDGVTANDANDVDTGANGLQNFPVLTSALSNAGGTQLNGTLNSMPNGSYTLDFYANPTCDSSGNGEGQTYLGSTNVTTDGTGNASFAYLAPASAADGAAVSATATSAYGDTSEFSACVTNSSTLPTVSVADASASEGVGTMAFTVSLSGPPPITPVTVDYATADGTATSPADYTATSGTLTFNAGQTSEQVTVPIVDDTLDENDETFTLTLSNPTNALLAAGQTTATGTILDDDAPPTVSITSVPNVTEPDTGSVNQTFTVALSAPSALPVSVVIDTVSGTATEGVDFTANAALLTFDPGQTTQTFTVAVLGDTLDEFNEKYSAQLLSPTNATIGTGSLTATIVDNDPPPNISIDDVSEPEGNSGSKGFLFTISLSAPSAKIVRVSIPTPTDGTATAPSDYVAHPPVLLNIPAGNTSRGYVVKVKGDTTVEPDETFFVNIDPANTVNGTVVDGQGVGTILNDD